MLTFTRRMAPNRSYAECYKLSLWTPGYILSDSMMDVLRLQRARRLCPMSCKAITSRQNLFLCQFLAGDCLVLGVIRAICTTVYAIVRQIERCEHHDAVTIEFLLDFFSKMKYAFYKVGLVAFQQQGCFAMAQSFTMGGLFNQLLDKCTVVFIVLAYSSVSRISSWWINSSAFDESFGISYIFFFSFSPQITRIF